LRKAKSRAKRLRFERRIRDSHRRWSLIGSLRNGEFRFMDGHLMLRASAYDLFVVMRESTGRGEFIHPNWIAGLHK
jgi:hypothetical protein